VLHSRKTALFIDGTNLYFTVKALGFDLDFKRLLSQIDLLSQVTRAFYYTLIADGQENTTIRPLLDWLDYNGYTVISKTAKEFVDSTGHRKLKGSMEIELAVDAMSLAKHIDHMVLFSGNGDFRRLLEAMQRQGVRVTVVSTMSTRPPMVADELRRQADVFVDVVDLRARIGRATTIKTHGPPERPYTRPIKTLVDDRQNENMKVRD
jgi:uncharacterized LabA/DUF88 family protein